MKAPIQNTTGTNRTVAMALAAAAGLALVHTQALAGGPSLLRLPVDGITAENQEDCATLLRKNLDSHLSQGENRITVEDGNVQFGLTVDRPISLALIHESLAGSAFKISDALMLDGAVRLEIGAADDPEKIATALRTDAETNIEVKEFENGTATILLESRQRHTKQERSRPLRSLPDVERIVREHDAKLLAVWWGADPMTYGEEDFAHWFCRDPFGAQRLEGARTVRGIERAIITNAIAKEK